MQTGQSPGLIPAWTPGVEHTQGVPASHSWCWAGSKGTELGEPTVEGTNWAGARAAWSLNEGGLRLGLLGRGCGEVGFFQMGRALPGTLAPYT